MNEFSGRSEYDALAKEVYARAGASLSHAQWFERSLVNHILQASLHPSLNTRSDWDQLETYLDKLTCGQLVRLVEELGINNPDLEAAIHNAKIARNNLVHGFFYRHSVDMYSSDGHDSIIKELSEMIESFEQAVRLLEASHSLYRKRMGLTPERIQAQMELLLSDEPTP